MDCVVDSQILNSTCNNTSLLQSLETLFIYVLGTGNLVFSVTSCVGMAFVFAS